MHIKNIIAVLLCSVLLLCSLTACKGGDDPEKTLTYEEYLNLSAEEQEAFIYSFPDISDFFLWHKEAKAKYDEEHKTPDIEIDGDGNIDINVGDHVNPEG